MKKNLKNKKFFQKPLDKKLKRDIIKSSKGKQNRKGEKAMTYTDFEVMVILADLTDEEREELARPYDEEDQG